MKSKWGIILSLGLVLALLQCALPVTPLAQGETAEQNSFTETQFSAPSTPFSKAIIPNALEAPVNFHTCQRSFFAFIKLSAAQSEVVKIAIPSIHSNFWQYNLQDASPPRYISIRVLLI